VAKKTDRNHQEIIRALRAAGASVFSTHEIGRGFPDAVIGYRGLNFLIEIKDGTLPPFRKRLTEQEQGFFDLWRGQVCVIENVDEVLRMIGARKVT